MFILYADAQFTLCNATNYFCKQVTSIVPFSLYQLYNQLDKMPMLQDFILRSLISIFIAQSQALSLTL